MKELERIFKAVSDGTRLRILCLLEPGSLCVCNIVEVLELAQSTVSKHLSILKNAGLVADSKSGRWSHYELIKKKKEVSSVLDLVFSSTRGDPRIRRDRRKLKKLIQDARIDCAS